VEQQGFAASRVVASREHPDPQGRSRSEIDFELAPVRG
jgi:hypothetical protein